MAYIAIGANFSDHKPSLRKESRLRSTSSGSATTDFENRIWRLFYDIGFTSLNTGGPVSVAFGRSAESCDRKSIDVLAQSHEARIYVECTTQAALTVKAKAWIQEAGEIQKFDHPSRDKRNIGFVLASREEVGDADRARLKLHGIVVFGPKEVDFFSRLATRYERLAYYQFLAFVFRSKRIESVDKESMEIPAIRFRYTDKRFCYLFAVHPATLIPISMVMHRASPSLEDDEAYQRLVKPAKIRAIQKHITKEGGVFPTNIIIAFDSPSPNSRFNAEPEQNGIVRGQLTLPNQFGAISVIDGQHRLFAYDQLRESTRDLVFVAAFESMPLSEQIQIFVDINFNQTKVPASLMWDLMTTLEPTDSEAAKKKVKVARVAKALNTQRGGALEGRIEYESAPHSDFGSRVSLESFCTTLRKAGASSFDEADLVKWLSSYFNAFRNQAPEHWNREDKKDNLLCSNQGIGALLMLFDHILNHIGHNEMSSQRVSTLVEPVAKYSLSLSISEIRAIKKGSSEANKKEILKKLAHAVRSIEPTFAPTLVEEDLSAEFKEHLEELARSGENDQLEAKEAFLINTRIPMQNGNPVENDKNAMDGILKTVVAMTNTFGGVIVLGVEDGTWTIKGLESSDLRFCAQDKDKFKRKVLEKISTGVLNTVKLPDIELCAAGDRLTCALLKVSPLPRSRIVGRKLCTLKSDQHAYKREGSSSVLLPPDKHEDWFSFLIEQLDANESEQE